jgi:hypothetical protein
MAFDPDEYLNEKGSPFTATTEFDPDAYLSELDSEKETEFDPDAYLEELSPVAGLRVPEAPPIVERPVEKTEEGILRKAADVPVRFLGGTAGVLKSVADVFGADSPASQDFAERQRFFQNLVSESGKEKDKRAAEIIKSTEDAGLWERAKSAGKAFLESPSSMLATGAGSLAPFIATAGVGTAARLGAAGVQGLQVAAGALTGAGQVKGEIYDAVKQAAIDAGKTPEEAEALASEAQSYGENPEQIVAGGAIGALAAATGIEATAGRAISGAARKLATGAQIVGKNVAQEVVTEVPQEAQTALAKNFALQKAGFDVPILQGVVEAGTTAGIVAAALGGAAGGIDAIAAASENAQKVKLAVNTQSAAQQVSDVAPLTASVVSDQAEVVGREGAEDLQTEADQKITEITQETPEQRVARLQEEATAAAGIELEEEPPVSGFPPERIKSARWFESASRNRLKELQDKDEAGVEDFTTQERDEFEFLKASPTPEQVAERYGYGVAPAVEPTAVTTTTPPTTPAVTEPVEPEPTLTPPPAATKPAGTAIADQPSPNLPPRAESPVEPRPTERLEGENARGIAARKEAWDDQYGDMRRGGRTHNEDGTPYQPTIFDETMAQVNSSGVISEDQDAMSAAIGTRSAVESGQAVKDLVNDGWVWDATQNRMVSPANPEQRPSDGLIEARRKIAEGATLTTPTPTTPTTPVTPVAPTPEGVTPTTVTPNLEPLRRVARAEQTEDDVSGLVGQGLVELYNGQPVITQAGLEALPEAERPRLTPEARKIQIDTGSNEVVAEAIAKNLRIGVDQVGPNVTLPTGWTLDGDIYVPPTPQEVAPAPEVRESRREPAPITQQDREYLDAVERGDAETQQRIVDERAREMGYDTKPLFHGTQASVINKFRKKLSGIWLAFDKKMATPSTGEYPTTVINAYADLGNNPITLTEEQTKEWQRSNSPLKWIRDFRLQNNATAVVIGDYATVVFQPSQVKSADAVTRDDQGNIIPPSQRFQPTEEDIRYARREPSVEMRQQYAPKTEEEQKAFDKASTNKVLARSPQLAVAAVRMKNGEITAGEYADLVDAIDPFTAKGADPIPTNEKIYQYMSKTMGASPNTEEGRAKLQKIGAAIPSGKVVEFRIDIPTYNESTKAGDTVYSVTAHEPVSETAKQVGKTISHLGIAKVTNPTFMNRAISGKGTAVAIAAGAGKFPLATVKGSYEPITDLPTDINDPNVWTEVGYNPIRSSFFVDVRSKDAVVGGSEAIMVGSRVFVKDAVLEPRPTGVTMGERYAKIQMPRPAGMETEAVATKLESLGFGRGGIVSVVNEPDASFEGRTIIRDGKVVAIELNAAVLKDDAAVERVLNHEIAESANADGALNTLVAGLTPKERKEINDAITRLGYAEKARTAEEAARAVELLAEGWRGRRWFERAVARVEAWANKLGYKLTRRAAEYIAARNASEINAEFKQAYNKFINVQGEAREGRAFVTPAENARFLELAQNPEANREELQKMVDEAARAAGYTEKAYHGTGAKFTEFATNVGETTEGAAFFAKDESVAWHFAEMQEVEPREQRVMKVWINPRNQKILGAKDVLKGGQHSFDKMREAIYDARREGFNSVLIKDVPEGGANAGSDQIGVFDPTQIKSADPVTYDDQGNVIPLSERFQTATPDIRYSLSETRESRREDAIPTFSEGSPEASTLSNMKDSMAKVDAASEAKGGRPETYKISEIASVWMDQGGDVRQLQDMVVEYTNLTPANAKKVANAIAKQYDIQQSIKTAFLETPAGISVEALPEGVTLPKEVDPDRPRPVMQRLFDVFMGVRVKPVKITGDEKALLKSQIRLKAAANRAAKQEQQRTADEVVEIIKSMELRGPVRPKQAQALAKRAAKVIWTSEKSMESFVEYAAKVVENANYDADLREAKAAQKRAKELSKQKKVAMSPQRLILQQIGNVAANKLDDPRMFAEMINYYLRGFKDVRSPDYVVVPDEEITGYISQLETESVKDQAEVERETNERLARKYDLDPNTIPELMSLINIIEEIEGRENREALESILTDKAIETQDGLRGYDTTALTNTQKNLVESMLNVDLKSINTQERQMFIRISNNMIYNNQTNGAEYFVATAKGQQNARKAAQDSKMIQRNKAWIPLIPSFGSLKLQETLRNFSLELQSVADTFRNVFGKDFMAKAYEMMGMLDLNEGFTKANNTIDEIQDLMAEFHQGNEKTYGDAARNQDGILSEGVAGFLIQEFPFKDEATSIQQRRNLINEYIANARESRQKDRVAMADRVEAILNKVDGASVQEILNNMKREYRPNYDSLMWYKDVLFPKYKDFLKQFDENFNDQANNYDSPNYLPIAFTSAGPALALGPEDVSIANSISLQPKQSVYTIKRQDYTKLPKDKDGNPKEIEFNLRRAAFNSLSDQINKAYTNPAWQQIFAFMKTPESVEFFGDKANRDFFVDRLNRLRASRARRGSVSGGALEKALDSFSIISRKLGTGIALGGVFQWIKQPPDQLLTALGSGGRADLLAKNIAPSTQKAARELLNQFSIGRRGDSSAGYKYINQMEGHQSRMERYFSESKWEQAKEQGGKIADVWMVALKKSDFISASAAWMTYYEGELNKNDIKIDDWAKEAELVKTDPVRRQAAAYAEQMTDIYQGSSDPTSMATFAQSGKTGWENFTKALLVPFNSFAIQQRMRLYSDARDALNGTSGGKGGLAGTIGGLILFHTTKRFVLPVISGGTAAVLYGMLGVDMEEPDEEKQKEMADRNWRQFLADITGNLLVGGTPQIVENRVIEAFNYASYMVGLQLESETVMDENGEIMSFDKYSKERSPFYRYKSYDNAMSLGMFDIGFDQAKETALQTKMLMDRDEMEMYTPEEQRLLYFSALSEWLYLMRLNDTDFARIVKKARRDMIKAAEEREKELARIRAGR